MTKIKCVIIEDESIAQRIITNYLEDLGDFELLAICSNAIEARPILEENKVDLIFLDIEMPKLNGLSFLRSLDSPPGVIITTAHREYALEGFDLEVVDYLLKPIAFERFIRAINKFKKSSQVGIDRTRPQDINTEILYVKSDKKTHKIKTCEINYIESMSNYIIMHLGEKKLIVYKSLSDIIDELGSDFVRIHKSYIVNKECVQYFTREQVMIGQKELPIGKTYKDKLAL